ncbi:hypothetical protein Rsub_08148 [Raphidocelis subcapitata]|uniref:Ig-like domain-containing protein n=1 Tax=Raphidocelis subcapitata TaxID=307507 RepID=A0A2V0PCS5_9CHLO|nr:hypothetical protein Rsub_08148 [Raphidocelis subcapitata]|eukprot:GBF94905.1 hypothetical protein Rsub_08148 [Raphidocelis subcapitata]
MARVKAVRLAAALLVWLAVAQAQDTSAVTPRSTIKFTTTATAVDSNVNTNGNALEWNTATIDAMQCLINTGDDRASPNCAASGGPSNTYFVGPMVQAGFPLGEKPILGMVYAHKECNGACDAAATQCRVCVVALANRRPNGNYLRLDATASQNWVDIQDFTTGKIVDGADVSTSPARFSPLRVGANLQGFEACTPYGAQFTNGSLIAPVAGSWVQIDAHLAIEYNTANKFETARLKKNEVSPVKVPGGIPVFLEACKAGAPEPAPSCVSAPTLAAAGPAEDLTADQCTSSTRYRVTLNAANTAAITPATGCTLENDARTAGTGAVSFLCGPLDRSTPYSLVFTATPSDAQCAPVTATVAITPPALQALVLTATPPTDEACNAQSGQLTFSVSASPNMAPAQSSGAVLAVTNEATGAAVQGCTSTPSAAGFLVACTGLADGQYTLAVTVPNTQYPACPYATTVTGTVTLIPAASLAAAGDAQDLTTDQCTDSTSYQVTLNAANTGAITPADGCTLDTDARTAGTGAVSFICGPLARATPYSLVFTAASTSSECAPVTATVAITPPALEAIALTATPPSDEACDAQSGQLTFSVAASPAMSAAQYNGAVLAVTNKATGAAVQGCTSTPSAAGFEVACAGLADGQYTLAVTVPNTQYAACPYATTVTGAVTLIPTASLAAAGDAQDLTTDQCTDSTSYQVTLNAANTGAITPADGCTLDTDARTAGTGAVSFICGPLARATPYSLVFTAASTSSECAPVTATVAITPPALEAIALTATPPTDEACDAQSGQLTFSVAASPAMSAAQYNGAVLVVTSKATGDAVQGCTSTPSAARFQVACSGLADGKYKLAVTVPNTQYPGCPHTGAVTGTVSIIAAPGFAITDLPAAQTICRATTTSFKFTATGAGDGLVYTYSPAGGANCGQPNKNSVVTCSGVGATVSVSAIAHYGQAQGEDCTTQALSVPLTVAYDPTVTATSVTATSPAALCPAVPSAAVSFAVTTSSAAASLTAVLLQKRSQAPVSGVTCTTSGAGRQWVVSCPGAPVGGSYVVSLAATSALGCTYDLGVDSSAVATVSAHDYALDAGADLSTFACIGSLGKATVTVKATGLSGATFTAVPKAPATCGAPQITAAGVVFECTGLPAGATEVVVTAVKTGCTLTDSVIITTAIEACCYTRTIGYWSTHGEEMRPWLAATPIQLWGRTFTASSMTASNTALTCNSDKPDALRVLCAPGQKVCSAAQLGRQCMAARVNLLITSKCGNANNCFRTANINRARLFACCGESGPAPSAAAVQACINDVDGFNQDKNALGNTCAASELPQGGPGLTQKVCNDYSTAFSKATATQFCVQGFCSTSSTGVWGRRRLLDV